MTTQELAGRRLIRAAKEGATWVFYALDAHADGAAVRTSTASTAGVGILTPATFEALAGRVLGEQFGTALSPGMVPGIRKQFDYVSADAQVVGDVSSPDFDDDNLRMEVEPYVELAQTGNRVSGSYHVGLQQGEIDDRIAGEGRVGFSFAGWTRWMRFMGEALWRLTARRPAFSWSIRRYVHVHLRAAYIADQSSIIRPGTWAKSRVLRVTRVVP